MGVVGLAGYALRCKYKGLHNTNTQIRASFSQSGDFIICGSDDGSVYFWTTACSKTASSPASKEEGAKQEKSGSFESFHAHDDIATVAIFAPEAAKRPAARKGQNLPDKVRGIEGRSRRFTLLESRPLWMCTIVVYASGLYGRSALRCVLAALGDVTFLFGASSGASGTLLCL